LCGITGIIVIALPVALLANNFSDYYKMHKYETQVIDIYDKKIKKKEGVVEI
jgi:hypothetical protein